MEESKFGWYVLCAISGKEGKVKEYIDLEIKNNRFNGLVREVLVPTEKVVSLRNGKRVVKERNYLPGYVLVEAALVGDTAHDLRSTPNVIGFLGGMDNPTPLRQAEVDRILGSVDEMQEIPTEESIPFVVGEAVKVTDGPFGGFTGVVEEVDDVKRKLTVTVKVFGRNTPLNLSFTQVTKEVG